VLITNVVAWDDVESMEGGLFELFYKPFERSTVWLGIVEFKNSYKRRPVSTARSSIASGYR
jgi:hypothetical protein